MSAGAGMPEARRTDPFAFVDVEWITLAMILGCYALWAIVLFQGPEISLSLTTGLLAVLIALHASLTHEVLHGHPFRSQALNEAMMLPALNLVIPYIRFRDTHLAHHLDACLTDPYDDPESNFLDPAEWSRMGPSRRLVYRLNNTLLGRMILGPALGQICFTCGDVRALVRGDAAVIRAWVLHLPFAVLILWVVALSPTPVWTYLVAAYLALGLLKIRTYLEHRAHEKCRARTVIIEDNGPLAWLFLYNSLHVVHHMHPGAPWYALPRLYREGRARYLACNETYIYRSYAEIFRQFLFRSKDPVPHPFWPQE